MTGSSCWQAVTGWRPDGAEYTACAVAWSYRLLNNNEQRVFRAMSVFPGPFTLAAAEAVAGKNAGQAVLRLVECSLLARRWSPGWPSSLQDAGDTARIRRRVAGRGRRAG